MDPIRRRIAATPLRATPRTRPASVEALVADLRPEEPVHVLRPRRFAATAAEFLAGFPGRTLYAVKCNPEPAVLRALWAGGVREFDAASAAEVRLVRNLFPTAQIHFMHPVKARSAIREAHGQHGVRSFVLDSAEELAKILAETGNARDLTLVVRLALPKGGAVMDLSGKFGAEPAEAAALLAAARPHARRLGVSFHVGSQCLEPLAYARAIGRAAAVIRAAGVPVEVLDVGGGFPVAYPGTVPPALATFMGAIRGAVAKEGLGAMDLWAEPGRALVASGATLVVQVQARKGGDLFINDGVYGALSDAGAPRFRFPARKLGAASAAPAVAFRFWGPTCDSADVMEGPFLLPADIAEGDWIEIGQIGAYGACLRTGFNGFDRAGMVELEDTEIPALALAA